MRVKKLGWETPVEKFPCVWESDPTDDLKFHISGKGDGVCVKSNAELVINKHVFMALRDYCANDSSASLWPVRRRGKIRGWDVTWGFGMYDENRCSLEKACSLDDPEWWASDELESLAGELERLAALARSLKK